MISDNRHPLDEVSKIQSTINNTNMKKILTLIALVVLFQLSACKDDTQEVSSHDQNVDMLTANPTVTHPDGDLSDQYENFVIIFTKKSAGGFDGDFLVANGGYAFPESLGSWKFNEDLTKIILDSGRELDVALSATHLNLDFIVTPEGGRIDGLSGHFTFDLQPQ
jgi:hypothetical protein